MARFASVRRTITENNRKQATAPAGAQIIPNPNGTAPGLICGDNRGEVICMPGVPHELYAMLDERVIPYLRERYNIKGGLYHRVLKVCGVGESWVDTQMGDLMARLDNPTIGVLASPEWVRIRITARADAQEEADERIAAVERQVRDRLPGLVMGTGDDTLEQVVDGLLQERGWTLAVGESFTGGMIAQRLTAANAGSFAGGIVHGLTDAAPGTEISARELARSVQSTFASTCGLGMVTDSAQRSLLTVLRTPESETAWKSSYHKLDPLNQLRTAVVALERLRRVLTGVALDHQDAKI